MSSERNRQPAGRRQTAQRRAILNALENAAGPLTPQEVLEQAGAEQAGLGLATVYRNLAALQSAGEVTTVLLPGEASRYEPVRQGHHHHFQCQDCSGVFEITQPCPVRVLEGVTLPGGFHVVDHALTFYGTCPACQVDPAQSGMTHA